jgi:WD40 repeat protein
MDETETPSSIIPSSSPSTEILRQLVSIDLPSRIVRFSKGGSWLALTPDNNNVLVIDPISGETIQQLDIQSAGENGTNAIDFSQDARFIATGGLEQRVDVFELETGTLVASLDTNNVFKSSVMIYDLIFDPRDDALIIASNWDLGGIAVWDFSKGTSSLIFTKPVNSITFDPSSSLVGLATWPTGITLETEVPIVLLDIHSGTFQEVPLTGVVGFDIKFESSLSQFYMAVDGDLYIADMENKKVIKKDYDIKGAIIKLDVSQNGTLAILSSDDYLYPRDAIFGRFVRPSVEYQISLINIIQDAVFASFDVVGVSDFDLSPDGSLLAVADMKKGVSIWEINVDY